MKKRWLCLFVENEIGVLAGISGLCSGKSYNLNSLTVGTTEDLTVSRLTISLTSDDKTFEQIKKQLNHCVEVIKVVDYSETAVHRKELMFVKINHCSEGDISELFRMSQIFRLSVIDYNQTAVLLESIQSENRNSDLISLLDSYFPNRLEIARGGSVAIEALSISP